MGDTPASGKRMPEDCGPDGVKRGKVRDGESENCSEAWDGKKVIVPLSSKGFLDGAAGQA
jgi:hypothetical protein